MGNPFSKTCGHSEEEKDDRNTVIISIGSRSGKKDKIKNSVKKIPYEESSTKNKTPESYKIMNPNNNIRSEKAITTNNEEHKNQNSFGSGLEELELKDVKFYKNKIQMSPSVFIKSRNVYNEQGQYDYDCETYLEDIGDKIGTVTVGSIYTIKYYYVGQFKKKANLADGIGITVFDSGDIYEGYYRKGVFNGKGRYIYSDGSFYIGEWKKGKRDGIGEFYSADGDIYIGEWKNDKKEGQGAYSYSNGTEEKGLWKDDKFEGETKS